MSKLVYSCRNCIPIDVTIIGVYTQLIAALRQAGAMGKMKGATADRPADLSSDDAGFQYFDTDLGKYIVWNGSDWANMDGTPLS